MTMFANTDWNLLVTQICCIYLAWRVYKIEKHVGLRDADGNWIDTPKARDRTGSAGGGE